MNGLAMRDGAPAYVTAVSESDVADGWRERRTGGGIVVDVSSGEVVGRGLSMPHSPRVHNGKLYLLDSGTGRFGMLDLGSGGFEEIAGVRLRREYVMDAPQGVRGWCLSVRHRPPPPKAPPGAQAALSPAVSRRSPEPSALATKIDP